MHILRHSDEKICKNSPHFQGSHPRTIIFQHKTVELQNYTEKFPALNALKSVEHKSASKKTFLISDPSTIFCNSTAHNSSSSAPQLLNSQQDTVHKGE